MVLRGMAQMHVDDLAERFKTLVAGHSGEANIQFAWVVFIKAECLARIQLLSKLSRKSRILSTALALMRYPSLKPNLTNSLKP